MNAEVECGCIILGGWFLRNKDCKIHGKGAKKGTAVKIDETKID